ncbi:MAG: YfhO family protein, partial [Candidatus Sumerlaeota bacterium]|nr:YfhO family protein [Candidatus Sumerlaeota bacterium]
WLLLGAAGAMQLLAGAPQIAFYSWVLVAVYALAGVLLLHRRCGGAEVDGVDRVDGVDAAPSSQSSHGQPPSTTAGGPASLPSIGNRQSAIGHPFGIPLSGWLAWAGLGAAALVALGLTAVQWAPTREFTALSFDRGRGASWEFVTDGSFRFSWVLTYLAPFLFGHPSDEAIYWGSDIGYWEFNGFAGVLAPALAVAGLAALRRKGDRQERRLAVYAFVCLALWAALAPGKYSPLFRLAYLFVPGFNRFRVPARWVLAYQLGLAVLAGLGWKRVAEKESRGARAGAMAALGLMAAAGLALTAFEPVWAPAMAEARGFGALLANPSAASELAVAFQGGALRLALSAGVALAVLLALRNKRLGAPAAACALLAVLADAGSFGVSMAQTTPRKDFAKQFYPDTDARQAVARRLAPGERWTWEDNVFYWTVDQNQLELYPNRPILYGLPTPRGYDPLNSLRYGQYSNALAGRDLDAPPRAFMFLERIAAPRLLSLLNVRVVLSYEPLESLDYRLAQAFPFGLKVYENPDPIGPAFLAEAEAVDLSSMEPGDPTPVLACLLAPRYDWKNRAVVEEANPFAAAPARENLPTKVETVEGGYGRWRFRVSAPKASVLVLGQSYYPGWQAMVDGKARNTIPVDWALTGVFLEPGTRDVEFTYHPKAFDRGAAVSVASILAWIVVFFGAVAWTRHRRHAGA